MSELVIKHNERSVKGIYLGNLVRLLYVYKYEENYIIHIHL